MYRLSDSPASWRQAAMALSMPLAGGGQLVFQKKVHGGAAGADRKGQASCKVAKGGKVFLRPFCLALGEKLPEQ